MNDPPPPPPPPGPPQPTTIKPSPKKFQGHLGSKSFKQQLVECCRHYPKGNLAIFAEGFEEGVLQEGPTCGLAALSMVLKGQKSVQDILSKAKEMRITNEGEMFSMDNFEALCRRFQVQSSVTSANELLKPDFVFNDQVVIAPYDVGKDQYPAKTGGGSAHHCLIIGIVAEVTDDDLDRLPASAEIGHEKLKILKDKRVKVKIGAGFYRLLVRQSKSLRLFLYKAEELIESNRNLVKCKEEEAERFVLPEKNGGIESGLSGKILKINLK